MYANSYYRRDIFLFLLFSKRERIENQTEDHKQKGAEALFCCMRFLRILRLSDAILGTLVLSRVFILLFNQNA